MLLYEHRLSSYAHKVKIALREKGVAFDVEVPADFGTGRTDGPFVAASPRAEVPALIDGDGALGPWRRRVSARSSIATTFRKFDGAGAKMAAASEMYVSGARRREYRDYRLEWMIKSGGLVVVQAGLKARNIRFPWPGAMNVPAD